MNFVVDFLGAAQLGVIFNAWMVGLVCVQGYNYYLNFPRDRMVLKILVAWVVVLQIFNLFIETSMIYRYLVVSFGDYASLLTVLWEWALYLGLIAIAACSVQLFYAYRILILSGRNYFIFATIVVLALAGLGLCSTVMIKAMTTNRDFSKLGDSMLVQGWLAVDVTCDGLIAIFQVYYLYRHRGGISSTRKFVNTLILYFISTGLLTSILVLFELISFAILGFNFAHVFLSYQMGAIHAMSFLANLDARRKMNPGSTGAIVVGSSGATGASAPQTGNSSSAGPWHVKVNTEFQEKTTTEFTSSLHSPGSEMKSPHQLPEWDRAGYTSSIHPSVVLGDRKEDHVGQAV